MKRKGAKMLVRLFPKNLQKPSKTYRVSLQSKFMLCEIAAFQVNCCCTVSIFRNIKTIALYSS
jgi:hypothetical protein